MIAIFTNSVDADKFATKIHDYLLVNRTGYNAEAWSYENKSETEEKWMVKVPSDYRKWDTKLTVSSIEDKFESTVTKLPVTWRSIEEIITKFENIK